jgi:ubiquitin carboxyl-terminal hydrolase 7
VQVKALRVQKLAKLGELKEQVEAELGVAVPLQRYWMWARRQNHTYRPSKYLTPVEDTKTLQEIKESAKSHVRGFGDSERDVKLYLEENLDAEGRPQPLPAIGRGDTLLFFKFYDAARGEIRFVGKTFVHLDRKFTELKDHMCAMAGLPPDEEIRLFEVSSRVACAPCALMNFANRRITRIRVGEDLTRPFHHARHVPHQSPVLGGCTLGVCRVQVTTPGNHCRKSSLSPT